MTTPLMHHPVSRTRIALGLACALIFVSQSFAHGTVVSPMSRVYRVYKSNPSNPSFQLAKNAVQMDGANSYYTWNELSRNIPEAVKAILPKGFDYSKWVPDGQLASGGRVLKNSTQYPRTYKGLDQVSANWPKTTVVGGSTITVDFLATAAHNPSVWDVWMTKPGWTPKTALNWKQMEFLGRPKPTQSSGHYKFPLKIPIDRVGHHVIWIAWQRNDPVGEVFFSTCDVEIQPLARHTTYGTGCPGSNKLAPTLKYLSRPILGQKLTLEVDRAALSSHVFLLFGRRTKIVLGTQAPGCSLLATPDLIHHVGIGTGAKMQFGFTVPTVARMHGVRLGNQFLTYDPKWLRLLPIALSEGGEATLGVK